MTARRLDPNTSPGAPSALLNALRAAGSRGMSLRDARRLGRIPGVAALREAGHRIDYGGRRFRLLPESLRVPR